MFTCCGLGTGVSMSYFPDSSPVTRSRILKVDPGLNRLPSAGLTYGLKPLTPVSFFRFSEAVLVECTESLFGL